MQRLPGKSGELVQQLVRQGWVLKRGSKHWKLHPPHGHWVSIPCTPSDWRADLDVLRKLRHAMRERGGPAATGSSPL